MEQNKHIVGIIPARGGSVGVPMKNIKLLCGKPLIAYTIELALKSQVLDRVIVSTDHEDIASVSRQYGAEVPFIRPSDISEDVDTELVLQHAVHYLENEEDYAVDAVVLLQPTSPLRTLKTLVDCVNKYQSLDGCDSVVTVNNIEGNRPEWMLSLNEDEKVIPYNTPFEEEGTPVIKLCARQSFPTLYKQNGIIYVTKRDLLMNKTLMIGPNAYAVCTDEQEALDIDTHVDFNIIEAIMQSKQ